MIALAIGAMVIMATLSLLIFARTHSQREQERLRAHQIVAEILELERFQLFTWTQSQSTRIVWDNGTPDDLSDDTTGQLQVIVTDPATGAVLTAAPEPAKIVAIEATLTWTPRGSRRANEIVRETVMTLKAP